MKLLLKWAFKGWWVALFVLSSSCLLEFKLLLLRTETSLFQNKLVELKELKENLAHECSHLRQEINSLDDKEFVTLLLIKTLGVVPEGQSKVVFKSELQVNLS